MSNSHHLRLPKRKSSSDSSSPAMADQSDFRFPATPGMPLFPLSPERVNKHKYGLPQSPSLPNIPTSDLQNEGYLLSDSNFSRQNEEASFKIPGSPSRRENPSPLEKSDGSGFSPPKHWRTNSDVQNIVARFNSLDIKDRLDEKLKKSEASLKRAQMGREEAEAEAKRYREEGREVKKELEESRDRERRVTKRLDAVMEDLHRAKEAHVGEKSLYEKETRRARKEAFKSSSAVVKLQEELKAARAHMTVIQTNLELEAAKARQKEQEAFNAQYQIVGVQEELAQARTQMNVVEEERDALKTNLREEEVARIAAEGRIALPSAIAEDDEFASPVKQKPVLRSQSPEKESSRARHELEYLREQVEIHRVRQEEAELQVDFMKMECQYGCCSCRVAERQGALFVHDTTFDAQIKRFKPQLGDIPTPPESMIVDEKEELQHDAVIDELPKAPVDRDEHEREVILTPAADSVEIKREPFDDVVFSSDSCTFRTAEAAQQSPANAAAIDAPVADFGSSSEDLASRRSADHGPHVHIKNTPEVIEPTHRRKSSALAVRIKRAASQMPWSMTHTAQVEEHGAQQDSHLDGQPDQRYQESARQDNEQDQRTPSPAQVVTAIGNEEEPTTPFNSNWQRTSTTTTKIPLKSDAADTPDYSAFCSPMNITREEAIEQLRARRGRARSVAGTPKKADATITPRRDISAPEVRAKGTPRSTSRGRLALR